MDIANSSLQLEWSGVFFFQWCVSNRICCSASVRVGRPPGPAVCLAEKQQSKALMELECHPLHLGSAPCQLWQG